MLLFFGVVFKTVFEAGRDGVRVNTVIISAFETLFQC